MKPLHKTKPKYSTGVAVKTSYGLYKNDLKKDFNDRCGYCDSPDKIWGGKASFQIDHFAPYHPFPHLKCEYTNLVYSCPICNRGKSNNWIGTDCAISIVNNEGFLHPCRDAYDGHLEREVDGRICPKSPVGQYMARLLKLYLRRHQVIWLKEELSELIRQVKPLKGNSSELEKRYNQLTEAYWEYDEVLKEIIDDR